MELLQLRYFCTVARMCNISRAAEHHRIPQPAMSKTISKLERELGVPLFDRVSNRLSLTLRGAEFYEQVSRLLANLDGAVEQLRSGEAPAGEIRVQALQHRSTIIDCLAAFRRKYPAVTFYLDCNGAPQDRTDFDFCLAEVAPDKRYDSSTSLLREEMLLALAADHPLAARERVALADLRDQNFACISAESSLWNVTLAQCRGQGFEPRPAILCGDLHCLIKYISAGMGVSIAPAASWRDFQGREVVFRPIEPALARETNLYWDSRRTMSAAMRLFREHIEQFFAGLQ